MEVAVRNLDGALDRRQQIEALLVAARAAVVRRGAQSSFQECESRADDCEEE